MEFSNEIIANILLWSVIILLVMGIILLISNSKFRLKSKKILPPSTTIFGAVHEFQTLEKREAIEQINEQQAGKKMEEEESGEPKK